jgi:hypothetical protein
MTVWRLPNFRWLAWTGHLKAATSAMPVKTDRIDARNIAWALQAGWYREVHVKSQGPTSSGRGFAVANLW